MTLKPLTFSISVYWGSLDPTSILCHTTHKPKVLTVTCINDGFKRSFECLSGSRVTGPHKFVVHFERRCIKSINISNLSNSNSVYKREIEQYLMFPIYYKI